jgi:isopentenyldiphosphate isomerase
MVYLQGEVQTSISRGSLVGTIGSVDKFGQYDAAAKSVGSAKKRLLVMERSPTLIEPENATQSYKSEFRKSMEAAIEQAKTAKIMFQYLFDAEQTRREMATQGLEYRNYARNRIYELKTWQQRYVNFRFDPVESRLPVPCVVTEESATLYVDQGSGLVIGVLINEPSVADRIYQFYSLAPTTTDSELSSMIELTYDDRDRVVLVNEEDEVIGTTNELMAHGKGLLHRGVHLEIRRDDGLVLICKRALTKAVEPGKWDFSVSGHCKPDDNSGPDENLYFKCLVRESKEELDLDLEKIRNKVENKGKYRFHTKSGENVIVTVFRVNLTKLEIDSTRLSEEVWGKDLVDAKELRRRAEKGELAEWYQNVLSGKGKV